MAGASAARESKQTDGDTVVTNEFAAMSLRPVTHPPPESKEHSALPRNRESPAPPPRSYVFAILRSKIRTNGKHLEHPVIAASKIAIHRLGYTQDLWPTIIANKLHRPNHEQCQQTDDILHCPTASLLQRDSSPLTVQLDASDPPSYRFLPSENSS